MEIREVEHWDDIVKNIEMIDLYLSKKVDPEYTYALNLIKKGTCFLKYHNKFYPSRFLGYKDNSMQMHDSNPIRNGIVTNKIISSILKVSKPVFDVKLNEEYQEYCRQLGFEPREKGSFGAERKFWSV